MTLSIDISPEEESPFVQDENETEEEVFADMRALALPTLQEYWDNEQDAVYDTL